jgi:predicted signal transduction protein with EAL and GGDEF domain
MPGRRAGWLQRRQGARDLRCLASQAGGGAHGRRITEVTVSVGVVEVDPTDDSAAIIRRADAALFEAKREGRNRVVVHDAMGRHRTVGDRALPDPGNGRLSAVRQVADKADPREA